MPGTAPRTVCGQSPPERGEHFSNGCTPMRVAKMGAARAHAPALPDLTLLPTAPPPYCRHISVHSRGSGDAIAEGFVMAGDVRRRAWRRGSWWAWCSGSCRRVLPSHKDVLGCCFCVPRQRPRREAMLVPPNVPAPVDVARLLAAHILLGFSMQRFDAAGYRYAGRNKWPARCRH